MSEQALAPEGKGIRQIVAGNVLALMGRNRVSQVKLGRFLGMSQPTLSKRLAGLVAWDIDELERIAEFFATSIPNLLREDARSTCFSPNVHVRALPEPEGTEQLEMYDLELTPYEFGRPPLVPV